MNSPTGDQFVITRPTATGEARAVITQVAAALRQYTIDGVDIVQPYPETVTPPFAAGIILAPWPNRVQDGTWQLEGHTQQLDLTEPARHNAIHGLLRVTGYRLVEHTDSSVTLAATVYPQHGYPFLLETTVRYQLGDDGLAVTHDVTNLTDGQAPVATGAHPFFTIGDVPNEDLVITVPASIYVDVDARLNPIAERAVDGTAFDLRAGRRVGDIDLDTAFGALAPVDGVVATLRAPDGREVRLTADDSHGYIQVFTTRLFPVGDGFGLAVAIEPTTAAPNAFNSGRGLRWVDPGETASVSWGIQYHRP